MESSNLNGVALLAILTLAITIVGLFLVIRKLTKSKLVNATKKVISTNDQISTTSSIVLTNPTNDVSNDIIIMPNLPTNEGTVLIPTMVPRVGRLEARVSRSRSGHCHFCNKGATNPMPTIRQVRNNRFVDHLFRIFGIKTPDKWYVDLNDEGHFVNEVCPEHLDRIRGLFETKVAEVNRSYSEFADKKRADIYEYTNHEAFEIVLDSEKQIISDNDKMVVSNPTKRRRIVSKENVVEPTDNIRSIKTK